MQSTATLEKKMVVNMLIRKVAIIPDKTIIPHIVSLLGRNLLHLDNPVPVESETISNPIQKNPNIRPEWTLKSGSCTPLR